MFEWITLLMLFFLLLAVYHRNIIWSSIATVLALALAIGVHQIEVPFPNNEIVTLEGGYIVSMIFIMIAFVMMIYSFQLAFELKK